MIDRLTEVLRFQGQALQLRAERQALLAGNVANADTPGYRAVDADFTAALARVSDAARSAAGQGPRGAGAVTLLASEVRPREPGQAAMDGNGVDLDGERARFAENAVRYEHALRTLNHQVRSLLDVIKG